MCMILQVESTDSGLKHYDESSYYELLNHISELKQYVVRKGIMLSFELYMKVYVWYFVKRQRLKC